MNNFLDKLKENNSFAIQIKSFWQEMKNGKMSENEFLEFCQLLALEFLELEKQNKLFQITRTVNNSPNYKIGKNLLKVCLTTILIIKIPYKN